MFHTECEHFVVNWKVKTKESLHGPGPCLYYIHTYINPITKSLVRMIQTWAMVTLFPTMEGMSFESLYRTFPLLYESGSDL